MNWLKRIVSGILAAAVMCSFTAPAVFADTGAISYENTDTDDSAVPELKLISSETYEMWAGTSAMIPVKFRLKKSGSFSFIKCSMSGGVKDVTPEKYEKIIDSDNKEIGTSFIVTAGATALAETYTFTVSANIYKSGSDSPVNTQSFDINVKVKSKLKVKGLTIDSYKVTKDPVRPGDKFDLEVTLRNNSGIDVKNAHLALDGLDSGKFILDTGFSDQYVDIANGRTGTAKFSLIAQNGISLVRENISLKLEYSLDETKTELGYSTSTQVIINCQPKDQEAEYNSHDLTLSGYKVSSTQVEKGTKFVLSVDIKNNGSANITDARISVGADGSKFSLESGLGYSDFSIRPGEVKSFSFKLIGGSGITSEREYIPVNIEFGAKSAAFQTIVSCKPANTDTQTSGKYDITLTDYSINVGTVAEGTIFQLSVSVRNNTKNNIGNARVSLEGLDGTKFAADSGLTYSDFDIKAGETKQFSFGLIGCKGISSIREVIPIQIDHGDSSMISYATVKCMPKDTSGTDEQGQKVFAPNIIIENYEYGGEFVTAGKQFPLTLVIKNTSSQAVIENLKVTVNGGTSHDGSIAYSPANSSNSFFFDSLGKKSVQTISLDLLPKSDAVPNSYPVIIDFTYEYSVGKERYQASGVTETITIPLRQEDRLVINEPELPGWGVNVGEMCTISMSLVNKGKSAVYNVTAKVEGDGFTVDTPSYYIGNINSGTEEYYDAKLTPMQEGDVTGEIVFTYEDANGESKESRTPFTFTAVSMNYTGDFMDGGMYDDGMMGMDGMVSEQNDNSWIWIAAGCSAAVIVLIIIIVVIVKHKKKKAELEVDDEDI